MKFVLHLIVSLLGKIDPNLHCLTTEANNELKIPIAVPKNTFKNIETY